MSVTSRLFRPRLAALALFSALFAAGCATGPNIASHPDPQARFQNYRTFSIAQERAPRNADITPELLRGIRDATVQAFERRGLTQAPEGQGDVIVLVHGGIEERVDIRDWGFNYGRFYRWGWGGGGPYELSQYREGTLLVDVFDAQSKELIWRGSAVGEVVGPPNLDRARAALNTIINRYPG